MTDPRCDPPEPWELNDEPDIWDRADQARAEFKENPDNWAGRK